jgi:hypothetical protein
MPANIDELKAKKTSLENDIKKFQEAIEHKLAKGDFDVDNICARVNQLEKQLVVVVNQLRIYDPCNADQQSEQDRKAIAIIGGGRGVEIRAKNDDATKYTVKKKLSYDEIIRKRMTPKPNGKATQSQQAVKI